MLTANERLNGCESIPILTTVLGGIAVLKARLKTSQETVTLKVLVIVMAR